jgi:hypothetical protein
MIPESMKPGTRSALLRIESDLEKFDANSTNPIMFPCFEALKASMEVL